MNNEMIEITSGLREGDIVIISSYKNYKNNQSIRLKEFE